MSHTSVYTASIPYVAPPTASIGTSVGTIGHVNEELLKEAIKFAAKELGGEVSGTFDARHKGKNLSSFNGKPLLASIRTLDMKEGMGVILTKDKKIQFVHDDYGNVTALEKAKTSVDRNYKTLAIATAMNKMGYCVALETLDSGHRVLTGTSK